MKNLLITGASGRLGKAILSQKIEGRKILTPSHQELDICNKESIELYFNKYKIDEIIHCAAIASVLKCEQEPGKAINTNSIGTSYLVNLTMKNPSLRFIYISTDYVYPGSIGNYKETDKLEPFTIYGFTKLEGELSVKNIKNHCIIRTSFFDPSNIPFDTAFTDSFCSKMPIAELAKAIIKMLKHDFIGVINVGDERISLYDLYKKHKSEIKPISLLDSKDQIKRAKDSSMDINLWREINK